MILVALPIVIALVYVQNKNKPARQLDEAAARSQFILEHPGFDVDEVMLSDDGDNAFLFSQSDQGIGLIHRMGQNFLTRILTSENIRKFKIRETDIVLWLADFTLTHLSVQIANPDDRVRLGHTFANLGGFDGSGRS